MDRVAVVALGLVLCSLSLAARPIHAQTEAAELAALKLSQACAESAATFWHRFGYDQSKPPAKGTSDLWSYQSHYNRELKRCLISIRLTTILPTGTVNSSEEIADAIEAGEPLAALHRTTNPAGSQHLMRGNQRIDDNESNLAWFQALMTR